jgi:hypothetical protein
MEDGTVDVGLIEQLVNGLLELLAHSIGMLGVDALAEVLVGADDDMGEIERKLELRLRHDDGRVRPERMPHAELVDRIQVGRGEVGDHDVRLQQQLVHRHVDQAGVLDVIRANALQPRLLHRLLDDDAIGLVEVERAAGGKVDLLAEAHDDEAFFLWIRHEFDQCRPWDGIPSTHP